MSGLRLRLVLTLGLALALPGCTREPANAAFAGKGVQLRFMFWGDPAEVETVRFTITQFEKANPGITVKLIHQPSSQYRNNLRIRVNAGDAPDVMYMGLEDYASFARNRQILPLDELIAKDPEFHKSDYFPQLIDQYSYEGRLYGLTKDFATLVLYYNKDLFDKWEVPYPKSGWTWDEFLETAKALTHENGPGAQDDDYGVALETWTGQWLPWVWQNGGEVIDEASRTWLMGHPEHLDTNAEAIQFLADLIWKHQVAPNPSNTRDQGASDVFKAGRAGMYTAGRWMCMQFKDIDSFDWDVVTLPRRKQRATCLFTTAFTISSQCKEREAAWALVKYLLGAEAQAEVANAGLAIPVHREVARSEAFTQPKAFPKTLKIDHEANLRDIPVAKAPPRLPVWPSIRETLSQRLRRVFNNQETAREALIALQKPIQDALANSYDPLDKEE